MDKITILFLLIISITGCLSQGEIAISGDSNNRVKTEGIYSHQFDNKNLVGNVHGYHVFGNGMRPQYGIGTGIDYSSSKLNGGLNLEHNFDRSTDVNANLRYRIMETPKSSLDANADYSRSFTPFGNTPGRFGGNLVYKRKF